MLLRLHTKDVDGVEQQFLEGDGEGHLDLPRIRKGGFGGGLFAIFVQSPEDFEDMAALMQGESYDIPLPELISSDEALPEVLAMAAILMRIERASGGGVKVCRTAGEIAECLDTGVLATVLHIEGAEAIDHDLNALDVLYQAGLRSLGPVWSRPTIFGHGVPFRYPASPDTGPGLTDSGKALVGACNELRIAIDLSHINEKGFWDIAALSDAPLIATHSNAHAVCPNTRNLTDRQLAAIRDSGGMVGLNFATCFLRPDGQQDEDTGLDVMLRHLDHLISAVGEDHVGLGSDFDGAVVPDAISDVAGVPELLSAMAAHGIDDALMAKICHQNWVNVLRRTWGE